MRLLSPLLSTLLAPLLVLEPLMAQSPLTAVPSAEALQIRMVDADRTNAQVGSHSNQGFTVEVTDAAGAGVRDAAVIFRLPDSGSSARFADGTLAAVTYTNADGKAHVSDIHWGDTPGSVMLRVTAVKGTAHAGLLFEESLSAAAAPVSAAVRQVIPVQPPTPILTPTRVAQPQSIPGADIEQRASITRPAAPGNLPAVSVTNNGVADDDSPDANVPSRHPLGAAHALEQTPDVSISSSGAASGGHSKAKWIAVLAVAAGAGAALALVRKGNTSSSSSGISIGSPSVSVGHP